MNTIHQQQECGIPRIAVIGCGAAAREFCWPVLSKLDGISGRVVVVDQLAAQARSAAAELGVQHYCTDYRDLPFDVNAAIVMTPHYLHAEHSLHFLRQGLPVFVEKPLGMNDAETDQMLDAARETNTVLMVNNCRRLFPSYRKVRELIRSQEFGRVRAIEIEDGSPFEWASVSGFYLQDAQRSRGVFLDRGAHTVDLICWWLDGEPHVVQSQFDALGGAEALMNVKCSLGETQVQLRFSRLFKLENRYKIILDHAEVTGRLFNQTTLEIVQAGRSRTIRAGTPAEYNEFAGQMIKNFIEVVQGTATPHFTADEVAASMRVITQAYSLATPIPSPWYLDDPNIALMKDTFSTDFL